MEPQTQNNKKNWNVLITIIGLIVVSVVIGLVISRDRGADMSSPSGTEVSSTSTAPTVPATPPTGSTSISTTPPASQSYTIAQVAMHSNATSCWSAVNGNVYDLTSWISQHPGGRDAILSICGKDGSVAFNTQHGGQPNPAQALATFKIGVLAK